MKQIAKNVLQNSKKKLGLYFHIPFCLKRCFYCNFYSSTNLSIISNFVVSLCNHVLQFKDLNLKNSYEIDSIYFGGGTPCLLSYSQLLQVFDVVSKVFSVADDAEISMECNPNSVTRLFLKNLNSFGFNRLSFGVQSACDHELELLGRLHNFEQAKQALNWAFEVGFKNLSADFIIGLPGQTLQSLEYSLREFSFLPLTHVSVYMLKIEPGTVFASKKFDNLPDDDALADIYERTCFHLTVCGFSRYEISNFAKPGFVCVHNLKYWTMQPFLGFGPSAHSYFEGERFFIKNDLNLYLNHNFEKHFESDDFATNLEWLMLRLRLAKPVLFSELSDNGFNIDLLKPKLKLLAESKLVSLTEQAFSLTTKGFLVQNIVFLFLTS